MENNTNHQNKIMPVDPQEFVTSMQEILAEKKGYKTDKKGLKSTNKKVKKNKKKKSTAPALFGVNLPQNQIREIVLGTEIDPLSITIDKDQKTYNKSDLSISANLFCNIVDNWTQRNFNPLEISAESVETINVKDNSDYSEDQRIKYKINTDLFDQIREYSIKNENRNKVFIYNGNIIINGMICGTYTGYLENATKINQLNDKIQKLEERIEELENNAIRNSDLGQNKDTEFIWAGEESEYQTIINRSNTSEIQEIINKTLFITDED